MGSLLLAFLALQPTPPTAGPYRIQDRAIVDARGRPHRIRGTELPPEGWNATALVTIRQRLNMNAVRISAAGQDWKAVERVVRLANRLELLAIVDAGDAPAAIRDNPNVILLGPSGIREVVPRYTDPASWQLPAGSILLRGLDPGLDEDSPECRAFPADPGAAARLLRQKLQSFDDRGVSWIASSFRPGRLIADYRYFVGTKLDNGWTCGAPSAAGLGMLLLAHLWNADPNGLFAVNGDSGGYRRPIGGRATVYGPTLADAEHYPPPGPLPTRLGNLSVRVTDSRGVGRLASLLYAAAGWAHINFIVPAAAAPGPAEIAVVRADGTRAVTRTVLGRAAPGLGSASLDGRGVAKAWRDGVPAWRCSADCDPLPLRAGSQVRFEGTGFRGASSVRAMVGECDARVVSFGPMQGVPGKDWVTIEIPDTPAGDADVLMWADGVLSNVVRIRVN